MPLTTGASASYQLFLHFILAYFCIVPIFFWALMISRFGPIKQLPSNTIDYAINTSGCRFPLPNHILWPPRNRKMRSRHNTCRGKELFVHFNNTNIPVLNAQLLLAAHGVTPEALTCYYSSLRMATTPPNAATNVAMLDSDVEFSAKRLLSFGTKLYEDGVRITCMKDGDNLFTEYHMVPQKKRLHMQRRSSIDDTLKMGGTHDKKLSVLVVGIESVSRLDAMRHLRKSRQYLLRQLNAYELLAYNGVGDGFRNKLALMTGFDKREVSRSQRNGFTDLSTHLVRAFGGRGYIRLFAEDVAFADPFLLGRPFVSLEELAEYYPKPVIKAMRNEETSAPCRSPTSRSEALLRYVSDVFRLRELRRRFGYLWLSQHTDGGFFNAVSYLDQPLKYFLRNLSKSGALNDTALVLLSSHGKATHDSVFNPGVRSTSAPFCFLVLPEKFLRRHPDVAVALEVNQRRLVTPYDLHATLLALATLPTLRFWSTGKGSTLLKAISPHRSCGDAFLSSNVCGCLEPQPQVVVNDSDRVHLATLAVDHMNEVTEMNFPHRCARWQLDSVGEAEVLGGGVVIGRVNIRVTITTMQKVTFYVFGGILTVGAPRHYLSYIERPNPLAEPAECIPDPAMKVYCLCVPTAKGTKYAAGSVEVRTKAY